MSDLVRRGMRKLTTRDDDVAEAMAELGARVAQLELDIAESRRLNERLSDVLDVVVELLVPAVQRDDARLQAALKKLGEVVPQ